MARARNIKPGFFRNAQLVELAFDRRLLFAGLWTLADREGRLEDRPKQIKMEIFPADNVDVDKALNDLAEAELILRYAAGGKRYIQIVSFLKHQHPHHMEAPSTIPKPETEPAVQESKTLDSAPVQAGQNLGQDLVSPEANPSDPLYLIPDSLNPSKALSGKEPDAIPPKADKLNGHRATAREILSFLNEKTGKRFEPVDANLELIVARLREATPDDIRSVIAMKCREWLADEKMNKCLRPATLFKRMNFAQYKGELKA